MKTIITIALFVLFLAAPVHAIDMDKLVDDLYQYGNGSDREAYRKIMEDSLKKSMVGMQKQLPMRLDEISQLVKALYVNGRFYYTVMLEGKSQKDLTVQKSRKFRTEIEGLNRNHVCTNGVIRSMIDVFDVSVLYTYVLANASHLFTQHIDKSTCAAFPHP